MDEYRECEECGQWKSTSQYAINNRIELHHIIFKSHAKYMANVKLNHKYICSQCHRINRNAVHNCYEKDLEYKQNFQVQLQEMFYKEYYTIHQIRTMLEISKKEAETIVKKLRLYKEGYKSSELIFKMCGDEDHFFRGKLI